MHTLKRQRAVSNAYEEALFGAPPSIDLIISQDGGFPADVPSLQWSSMDMQQSQRPTIERARTPNKRFRVSPSTETLSQIQPETWQTSCPLLAFAQQNDQSMTGMEVTPTQPMIEVPAPIRPQQQQNTLQIPRPTLERHDSFNSFTEALFVTLDFKDHVGRCWYMLRGRYRQYPHLHRASACDEVWETLCVNIKEIVDMTTPYSAYETKRNALIALARIGKDVCWMDHGALRQSIRQRIQSCSILEQGMLYIIGNMNEEEKARLFCQGEDNWVKIMYRLVEMNAAENMFVEERFWDALRGVEGLFWSAAVSAAQQDPKEPSLWHWQFSVV